jgi:hypothetical protein
MNYELAKSYFEVLYDDYVIFVRRSVIAEPCLGSPNVN